MKGMSSTAIGFLAAAGVVAIWSGFIVISRAGLVGTVAPLDLALLRFIVAAAVSLPFLLMTGWQGMGLRQAGLGRALVLALTAGLGFVLLAFHGFERAPANHGAVMLPGVLPLWIALLTWVALGERPTGLRALGLVSIAAGVVLLVGDSIGGTLRQAVGDGMFLGASFSWAIFTLLARRWQVPPMHAATVVSVGSLLLFLPIYAVFGTGEVWRLPWGVILGQGFYQGVLATIASVFLFTKAVAALGAQRTAMVTAVVPTTATLAAIPVVGDVPTGLAVVGLGLVTAGMITAVLPQR